MKRSFRFLREVWLAFKKESQYDDFGHYQILSPLGSGGMGEVYRARDRRLAREVAIKVLPEHLAKDANALARFEREARAVAALSHPNIRAIYEFGERQGSPFAVMELLEGETLRRCIERGNLPWRRAVEITVAITEGLCAAHSKGITHRDLKPENIFLTSDGQVKILDFGLARFQGFARAQNASGLPAISETLPGVMMGTLQYMSPEQVRGDRADARSDIYAVGCILYEMISGTNPFTRKTAADTMVAILRANSLVDLASNANDIPTELDHLIRHCMSKNPEDRIQSAQDLCSALKSLR